MMMQSGYAPQLQQQPLAPGYGQQPYSPQQGQVPNYGGQQPYGQVPSGQQIAPQVVSDMVLRLTSAALATVLECVSTVPEAKNQLCSQGQFSPQTFSAVLAEAARRCAPIVAGLTSQIGTGAPQQPGMGIPGQFDMSGQQVPQAPYGPPGQQPFGMPYGQFGGQPQPQPWLGQQSQFGGQLGQHSQFGGQPPIPDQQLAQPFGQFPTPPSPYPPSQQYGQFGEAPQTWR